MKSAYDVVVIGAGPAGSTAARRAALKGLDVLLIEKRQEIGSLVRCAEAVGADTLRAYIDLDPRWINAEIDRYAIYNAKGDSICLPPTEPTLVVERKVFDRELARLAGDAGAEVQANTSAVGLVQHNGRVEGVEIHRMGRDYRVAAGLVVAADGPESQVARWAGLKTTPPLANYYVGVQFLLGRVGDAVRSAECQYHLDTGIAPGGYAWVFPKGHNTANVGLVIDASQNHAENAARHLERFVARRFPHSGVLSVVFGGIPVTGGIEQMGTGGLMVVGDAAHQADPLTGGGIGWGMIGAEMAVEVGAEALRAGDVSAEALGAYQANWKKRFGRSRQALLGLRKAIKKLGQEDLDALITDAAELPLETMSLGAVALKLFVKQPALLMQMGKLIATGFILK